MPVQARPVQTNRPPAGDSRRRRDAPRGGRKAPRCLASWIAIAGCLLSAPGQAGTKGTFAIDYVVTVSADDTKTAQIRWELSGIDEIDDLRLRFPSDRFDGFAGSGVLEQSAGYVRWVPGGPYAHLSYRVRIDHRRGRQQRYDSYAATDWIVTRARDLFPRTLVNYTPRGKQAPKSRARLIFHLPDGWHSVTPHEPAGADTFLLSEPGKVLDRPRGWFALGRLDVSRQEIADAMVLVARAPGSTLDTAGLFRLYDRTLPLLRRLLPQPSDRILVVSAPDPMWHGGVSGAGSFFLHGDRPLRTPDKTSPYLHEMFHVLQPFKPAADADWIEEGLAEYYSIELQRRTGLLDATDFMHGLEYLQRYGLWRVDLTKQQDNAATNNSAPLIMYALDRRIQRATAGNRRLDDVVTALARAGGIVDTACFQREAERVAERKFGMFFRRHVIEGNPPQLREATP
jgi:hypothetical protein